MGKTRTLRILALLPGRALALLLAPPRTAPPRAPAAVVVNALLAGSDEAWTFFLVVFIVFRGADVDRSEVDRGV